MNKKQANLFLLFTCKKLNAEQSPENCLIVICLNFLCKLFFVFVKFIGHPSLNINC